MKRLAVVGAFILLSGCAQMKTAEIRETLDRSVSEFHRTLRWKELDAACARLLDEKLAPECRNRHEAMRDLTVAEVRPGNVDVLDDGKKARIKVEVDYFVLPSNRLRTVKFEEEWIFAEKKGWRLMTLPPLLPAE